MTLLLSLEIGLIVNRLKAHHKPGALYLRSGCIGEVQMRADEYHASTI
jgi:hypothetical protein